MVIVELLNKLFGEGKTIAFALAGVSAVVAFCLFMFGQKMRQDGKERIVNIGIAILGISVTLSVIAYLQTLGG